ncbi:MAG: PEP-CTERM sorting domain-containing protein [Planctomycetes bacterium]|nr:PEP-CTERM sorting domain-containing protein [Planctomycetota bacterium]
MRCLSLFAAAALLAAAGGRAGANTVESSTLWFVGTLTPEAGGGYSGTIDMASGKYYNPGGGGAGIWTDGGFDVYARQGGTAYVQGMTPDTWTIGANHDAYSAAGPWGTWYDPDCADWRSYELELTSDHWYLRYKSPSEKALHGANPSPMSGAMDWGNLIAHETDAGTQYGTLDPYGHDPSTAHGGGAGAWDWSVTWGTEVVPLQYADFKVTVTYLGNFSGEDTYEVSLTPVPEPLTLAGLLLGVGGAAGYVRRRRG